jgi:hypothetical protein
MRVPRPNGSCTHDAAVVPIVIVSVVAEADTNVQVDSDGKPEQVKLGADNPPRRAKVMVPVPVCPGEDTVTFNVLGPMVKSSTARDCPVETEAARLESPG